MSVLDLDHHLDCNERGNRWLRRPVPGLAAVLVGLVAVLAAAWPAHVAAQSDAALIGSGEALVAQHDASAAGSLLQRQSRGIVRVVRPYGAAVRTSPSSDAETRIIAACNDVLEVLDAQDGWYQVAYTGGRRGWVGAGRVSTVSGDYPPFADCGRGVTFQVGDIVAPSVATGCLSLRSSPSRQAPILTCVGNDARYAIFNGPFDPGTGEEWFHLVGPGSGGWALADYFVPSELPPGYVH